VTFFTKADRPIPIARRRLHDAPMAPVILVAALLAAVLASTFAAARLGR